MIHRVIHPAVTHPGDTPTHRRNRLAVRLWRAYCRWSLGRSLDGVWVSGLDATRERLAAGPLILAATHVAWWDGLVVTVAGAALDAEDFVWVDAPTVRRLPWLTRVGAIAVDRAGPASARAGIRAAAAVVDRPGRALWIYPQGRQRPAWLRPLDLQPGVALVARRSDALVVPVALQYAFREADRPAAVLHFGAPVAPPELERALVEGLARVDLFLTEGDPSFTPLVPPRATPGRPRTDRGIGARLLSLISPEPR